jgi:hypothetical protein
LRPRERHELANAKASAVAHRNEDAIAGRLAGANERPDVDLVDDSLGGLSAFAPDNHAGVELQIAEAMAVAEQGFNAQHRLADPFLFYTGRFDLPALPWPTVPVIHKPSPIIRIVSALASVMTRLCQEGFPAFYPVA